MGNYFLDIKYYRLLETDETTTIADIIIHLDNDMSTMIIKKNDFFRQPKIVQVNS